MKRSILAFVVLAAMLGAGALGCAQKKESSGEATPAPSSGATSGMSEWTYGEPPSPVLEGTPAYRLNTVAFAEGSDELKPEAIAACSEAAAKLKELPHVRVAVIGFADGVKEKDGAEDLGLCRAESVRDYLASQGIPAEWVQAATYGDRASSGDAAKMETERRAEVWILQ